MARRAPSHEGAPLRYVNQYELGRVLGCGSYGVVHHCIDRNAGTAYAVKILDKSLLKRKRVGQFGNALQGVQREIAIWKKLDHPNIVRLVEVLDDAAHDKLYLVSELVAGGAVVAEAAEEEEAAVGGGAGAGSRGDAEMGSDGDAVTGCSGDAVTGCIDAGRPDGEEVVYMPASMGPAPLRPPPFVSAEAARDIMVQLLDGLVYLHFQQVAHRDIKPANLLSTATAAAAEQGGWPGERIIKIADFGVSSVGGDPCRSTAGTAAFLAPEMLSATGAGFSGFKADMWACGMTLYTLLHGQPAFLAPTLPAIYALIQSAEVAWQPQGAAPHARADAAPTPSAAWGETAARDLVMRLLDRSPDTRPSAEEARRHPFLTGIVSLRPQQVLPALRLISINAADIENAIRPTIPFQVAVKIAALARRHVLRARRRGRGAQRDRDSREEGAAGGAGAGPG